MEGRITQSVKELGDLLLSIKGGGQVTLNQPSQRNAVAAEADEVLRPLMDLLDGKLNISTTTVVHHYYNQVSFLLFVSFPFLS